MIYELLADGFEETEAIAPVDLLRRAGLEVQTVSITKEREVRGSHGIPVLADLTMDQFSADAEDTLILPGGKRGTDHLKASEQVSRLLSAHAAGARGRIAAICAAPSVLGRLGILRGKLATCHAGFEDTLEGASFTDSPVVTDGLITTSRGMGTSIAFGLELVKLLKDEETAERIAGDIHLRAD